MLFTELPLKKSKHIPYSNKLPSQFVTNTLYVSPLKICRTVVRQILYMVYAVGPVTQYRKVHSSKHTP